MTTLTARNLAGVAWVEDGKRAEYQNARRTFGVQREDGAWLSFNGIRPYAPSGGRKAAVEVAATVIIDDPRTQWVHAV